MADTEERGLGYWLALLHAPGIGARRFAELLERTPGPRALFEASASQLQAWGISERLRAYLRAPNWGAVEQDLAWRDGEWRHILTLDDPRYPVLLREIADAPPLLFVHGDPDLLSLPQLAMVGSRNPTPQGRETAREFAAYLAKSGLAITSGLAMGVDGACHEGALRGNGVTLAVTATGLDRVYPASHRELAHRIVERGAMISEFPIGTPPRAGHFPKRNRIISGLSLGTLVVEATLKSGSLITARLALEQGREVFAIPGSIHNPQARGCHRLIRGGAKLVETAGDIIEELGALLGGLEPAGDTTADNSAGGEAGQLEDDYQRLLDAMGFDPVAIDVLASRSGFKSGEVSSMLLLLELEGHVAPAPGGGYCRTGAPVDAASSGPEASSG